MLNGPAWLPVYAQMPLRAASGHGSWIVDEAGHEWLDAYGGHAVASTGHCHPTVVRAIQEQAAKLIFYSTALPHRLRETLADRLAERCPGDLSRVFFCNSGAEANENALAVARKATGRTRIVSIEGGWHGRTLACVTVTDGERYVATAARAGAPVSTKVRLNDSAALTRAVDETVAAVILEPVQGMTGARDCSSEFLQAARTTCDRHGAALIFDEIQCGFGRTGAFTAAEHYGVTPDVLTMATGMASGFPIGAMVATRAITSGLVIGDLGSTFGGGPLASAAALATLDVFDDEGVLANVRQVSMQLMEGSRRLDVSDVQGRGLLLGYRLRKPAAQVQKALFGHRVLTGTSTDPQVMRLMPPLTFSREEADILLSALGKVLAP
jgi:acetylornithine/succinyldiaminopimelate/putrescine aminotransferase